MINYSKRLIAEKERKYTRWSSGIEEQWLRIRNAKTSSRVGLSSLCILMKMVLWISIRSRVDILLWRTWRKNVFLNKSIVIGWKEDPNEGSNTIDWSDSNKTGNFIFIDVRNSRFFLPSLSIEHHRCDYSHTNGKKNETCIHLKIKLFSSL